MTVIIGANYGSEILVLADTRVSFPEENSPPKNELRKLVPIRFQQRGAILGFSGDVGLIQQIVRYIRSKAKYSTSSGSLKDDLKKWMQEPILRKPIKNRLRFMLCDFDPSVESNIHVYELKRNREVILHPQEGPPFPGLVAVTVIGRGSNYKTQIYKHILQFSVGPKGYDDSDAFSRGRAVMTQVFISSWFQSLALDDIGGPFLTYLVRPDEVIGPDYFPPMQVTLNGDTTILQDPLTDEEHTLYSILSYQPRGGACASLT